MAGCKPEYFPVVLAALEAALDPDFTWYGLLSTTMGVGPVVVVNGPIAKRIGMNWGFNVLGHGNRANATIARALQLVARNVGGAVPGVWTARLSVIRGSSACASPRTKPMKLGSRCRSREVCPAGCPR